MPVALPCPSDHLAVVKTQGFQRPTPRPSRTRRNVEALDDSHQVLMSSATDSTLRLWDTRVGRQTAAVNFSANYQGEDCGVWVHAMGSTTASLAVQRSCPSTKSPPTHIHTHPTPSPLTVPLLPPIRAAGNVYPVGGMSVRPDGLYFGAGCFDGHVYIVDRRQMRVLHPLQGHTDRVTRLSMRSNDIISGGFDSTVHLWQFE
jgi:WD40 repeat protein